jgi:hypothetical protein
MTFSRELAYTFHYASVKQLFPRARFPPHWSHALGLATLVTSARPQVQSLSAPPADPSSSS